MINEQEHPCPKYTLPEWITNIPLPAKQFSVPAERSLEWSVHPRVFGMSFWVQFLISVSLPSLVSLIPHRPPAHPVILALCLFLLALIALLCVRFVVSGKKVGRTLHITRQTITLIDTNALGVKERRMDSTEAKVCAVHIDFFDRLFTSDLYRMDSAYHVEITNIGESFLFPCNDEEDQSQIIKQIKELITPDKL